MYLTINILATPKKKINQIMQTVHGERCSANLSML
jgi:hypothetical protein